MEALKSVWECSLEMEVNLLSAMLLQEGSTKDILLKMNCILGHFKIQKPVQKVILHPSNANYVVTSV